MTTQTVSRNRPSRLSNALDKALGLDPIDSYPDPFPGNKEATMTTYEALMAYALTIMLAIVFFGGIAWAILT